MRFWILDFGFWNLIVIQSKIQNPKSKIQNRFNHAPLIRRSASASPPLFGGGEGTASGSFEQLCRAGGAGSEGWYDAGHQRRNDEGHHA